MKVLQINSVCGYGSTGRIAVDLSKELMKSGHECYIAYGRKKNSASDEVKTIRIGNNLDVLIHGVMSRFTDRHGFYSVRATKNFVKWMKVYNPDVVHLHNLHGYYINLPVLFNGLRELGKPVIWTLHDCWAFTGHCSYFDYIGCERWREECYNCPQKKEYPVSLFLDSSRRNFKDKRELFTDVPNLMIITPSMWLKELVSQSFLGSYKNVVIHNGIDLGKFCPKVSEIRKKYQLEGKKVILGVANVWDKRKGLEEFKKLSKFLPEKYQIVLVGIDGRQKTSLGANIMGIERTNSVEELTEIYSMADVFVNPTLEDNFPTTNLEALACGTPVITYATGGSGESINGDSGRVIVKGDIEVLKQEIEKICLSKGRFADNCIKQSKKYDKEEWAKEYFEIYRRYI